MTAFCLEECDQNCGSEPARECGGSVNEDVECEAAFASRLAPTGWLRCCWRNAIKNCRSEPARDSVVSGK